MEYIITESQYRKIIVEQATNPIGKKSVRGNFSILNFTNLADSEGIISLYPNVNYKIKIIIKNISKENLPIVIESVKFSDEGKIKDLNFTQQPILVGKNGVIVFNLISSNKSDSEIFSNLSIDINAIVVNKNIKDNLRIDFKYNTKPSNTRFNLCKSKYNLQQLKKSVDWYKTWLGNPITKQKFAKNFKYDTKTVEKHFANYLKILDQIKIEYENSNIPNGGWVQPSLLQKLGLKTGGYEIPITINCTVSSNDDNKKIQDLLIHEIQHILDSYHKLHPYRNDILSFYNEKFEEILSNATDVPQEEIKNLLKREGFSSESATKIASSYSWTYKNDYEHLTNTNENLSSLFSLRERLGLTPEQPITKEILIKNDFKWPVRFFIFLWIFSGLSLNEFLANQNSIARNKQVKDKNVDFV